MKKTTRYFQHDYNARNDSKLVNVMIKHGVAGIGVFWCIVEQLYEHDGRLLLSEINCIAFALHTEYNIVSDVIQMYGLFENDGTYFWSNSVNERLKKQKEVSEKRKAAINARWSKSNVIQENNTCNTIEPLNNKYKNILFEREEEREEFLASFMGDAITLEAFCMNLGITTEQCRELAKAVLVEWSLGKVSHSSESDAKRHLINQIRTKYYAEKRKPTNNGTTANNGSNFSREQQQREFVDHIKDKLTGARREDPDITGNY